MKQRTMKRLAGLATAFFLSVSTATAQLCAPSNTDKSAVITYTSAALSVDLTGGIRTVVTGELKEDSVLMPRIDYTYPSYPGFDKMIKQFKVLVTFEMLPKPSLIGETPGKKEAETRIVSFLPTDSEMTHFKGSLDLATQGWDRVTVEALPNSAELIKKSDFKNELINEKK